MSQNVQNNLQTQIVIKESIESKDEISLQKNTNKKCTNNNLSLTENDQNIVSKLDCTNNNLSLTENDQNIVSKLDILQSHIVTGGNLSTAMFANTECDKVDLDKTRNDPKTENISQSLKKNCNIKSKETIDQIVESEQTILKKEIKLELEDEETSGEINIKQEADEDCVEPMEESPSTSIKIERNGKMIKKHKCPVEGCTLAFERPGRLANHMRCHTNQRIFKCCLPYCDKSYTNVTHLKRHMQISHGPEGTPSHNVDCLFRGCDKKFQTKSGMKKHYDTFHVNPKSRFACDYCSESFRYSSLYNTHLMESHNVQQIRCDICNIGFTTQHARNRHMRRHRTFRCDDPRCEGIEFEKYNDKRTHDKLVHPSVYACNDCSFQTNRKLFLEEHVYRHLPDWARPIYKCTYGTCKRTFLQMRNYLRHCKYYHSQVHVVYPCTEGCSGTFTTKQSLQRHIAKLHDPTKPENQIDMRDLPFGCKFEKCQKRFSTEKKVHRHFLRMHRDKRPGEHVVLAVPTLSSTSHQISVGHVEASLSSTSHQISVGHVEASHINNFLSSADHFLSDIVRYEESNRNTLSDKINKK